MAELGQLHRSHAEFEKRKVRIVAVSNDDLESAKATQERFPQLVIVSDPEQTLAKSADVIQKGAGKSGEDTNAPTTFLVDGSGRVRWLFRPDNFLVRPSPAQVLAAIDEHLPK